MICPFCGYDNIPGMDRCEECMHPLRDLDVPRPTEGLQKHIMQDAVKLLNLAHPVNVQAGDSVARTIELMKQHRVGCALVLEGERLVGIFTERDILFNLAGTQQDLERLTMRRAMIPEPVTLKLEDSMAMALHHMSVGGFRHLPVVAKDGSPLGLISIKDILGYIYEKVLHARAEEMAQGM
ncbi:MAG: CBS domain-containing protein [Acidobacteria bacterium]|nr:CBS domain-containing protein [Acidobacteriota bacterium]